MTTLANRLGRCAVAGVVRAEPNVLEESLEPEQSEGHTVAEPRRVHPAFYGCYDWHSAVHSHWLLLRLLRTRGALEPALAAEVAGVLDDHFTLAAMGVEAASLAENGAGWEMPYGMAWLLRLKQELDEWAAEGKGDSAAALRVPAWQAAVGVLEEAVLARLSAWLSGLPEPDRGGAHRNTAFSLGLALDYARSPHTHGSALADPICDTARRFYGDDSDASDPAAVDGRGRAAFLSPSLTVADLMRRVLGPEELLPWLDRFYPRAQSWTPDGDGTQATSSPSTVQVQRAARHGACTS